VRGHRVSNCQHSDRPLQHINKKVCYDFLLFVLCSLALHRVVPYHSALTVEPSASLDPPMSVVTVAARRHTLRELVLKTAIHRVSFSRDI
jgi:hypothetical protein